MSEIPPSIPIHVARAYGGLAAGRRMILPVSTQTATLREAAPRVPSAAISRVVAARVPGGIDFSTDTPTPTASAMPFYRHPADKNAAATAVSAGRVIDTTA